MSSEIHQRFQAWLTGPNHGVDTMLGHTVARAMARVVIPIDPKGPILSRSDHSHSKLPVHNLVPNVLGT
jgi:hypothetical protein